MLLQVRNISTLAETAIYVATVEKYTEFLREILNWVAENKEEVGDIKMDNADCILHAALEDDKDQVMLEPHDMTDTTQPPSLPSRFAFYTPLASDLWPTTLGESTKIISRRSSCSKLEPAPSTALWPSSSLRTWRRTIR